MEPVMIKGVKSGIVLVLDSDIPYEQLKKDIVQKFTEASAFLGRSRMGLMVRGRLLTEEQEAEVLKIIAEHTDVDIVCVMKEDGSLDQAFEKYVTQRKRVSHDGTAVNRAPEPAVQSPVVQQTPVAGPSSGNALIYKGNVRSGQSLCSEHSLIILGDVNPGGSLVSDGSIFVMGSLLGNAFAGATGNQNAFIMANDFHPLQVRISDAIAVSPNEEGGKSGKFLGRHNRNIIRGPEVAYLVSGQIARSAYTDQFVKENHFF